MAAFGIILRPPAVDTGLIFSTDNSVASVLGPGVCCGMTSNWIATCKKLGRPVKTSGELSDPSSFVISQSGGEKGLDRGDDGIMRSAGLTPPTPTETRPVSFNTVATTLSGFQGYTFLTIHSNSAGHAMGSYVTATQWDFFDPNIGLYRFNSAQGFVTHLQTKSGRHVSVSEQLLAHLPLLICRRTAAAWRRAEPLRLLWNGKDNPHARCVYRLQLRHFA